MGYPLPCLFQSAASENCRHLSLVVRGATSVIKGLYLTGDGFTDIPQALGRWGPSLKNRLRLACTDRCGAAGAQGDPYLLAVAIGIQGSANAVGERAGSRGTICRRRSCSTCQTR